VNVSQILNIKMIEEIVKIPLIINFDCQCNSTNRWIGTWRAAKFEKSGQAERCMGPIGQSVYRWPHRLINDLDQLRRCREGALGNGQKRIGREIVLDNCAIWISFECRIECEYHCGYVCSS